jgi:nucleoside 2-deoxyribosyltransferase
MTKRIYVAGPYSADNVIDVLKNIGKGKHFSAQVFKMGMAPFCPWADDIYCQILWGEDLSVKQFQKASMAWVEVCDAMLLVPGWENSKGTKAEIKHANKLGIPVFKTLEGIQNWKMEQDIADIVLKES